MTYPSLLRSISRGKTARRYVHVQMVKRITSSSDLGSSKFLGKLGSGEITILCLHCCLQIRMTVQRRADRRREVGGIFDYLASG